MKEIEEQFILRTYKSLKKIVEDELNDNEIYDEDKKAKEYLLHELVQLQQIPKDFIDVFNALIEEMTEINVYQNFRIGFLGGMYFGEKRYDEFQNIFKTEEQEN